MPPMMPHAPGRVRGTVAAALGATVGATAVGLGGAPGAAAAPNIGAFVGAASAIAGTQSKSGGVGRAAPVPRPPPPPPPPRSASTEPALAKPLTPGGRLPEALPTGPVATTAPKTRPRAPVAGGAPAARAHAAGATAGSVLVAKAAGDGAHDAGAAAAGADPAVLWQAPQQVPPASEAAAAQVVAVRADDIAALQNAGVCMVTEVKNWPRAFTPSAPCCACPAAAPRADAGGPFRGSAVARGRGEDAAGIVRGDHAPAAEARAPQRKCARQRPVATLG